MTPEDLFLALIAILFPPFPVWVRSGFCSLDSLVNVVLCLLFVFPGTLHAWWVVLRSSPDSPCRNPACPHHAAAAGSHPNGPGPGPGPGPAAGGHRYHPGYGTCPHAGAAGQAAPRQDGYESLPAIESQQAYTDGPGAPTRPLKKGAPPTEGTPADPPPAYQS